MLTLVLAESFTPEEILFLVACGKVWVEVAEFDSAEGAISDYGTSDYEGIDDDDREEI